MSCVPRLIAALALLPAAAPAPLFTPGLWTGTMSMTVESVNGSRELAQKLKTAIPPADRTTLCYTAEMLSDPANLIFGGTEKGCRFDRISIRDGRIDMAGDCDGSDGIALHVQGGGTYDAGRYDVRFTGTGEASGTHMEISGTTNGQRAGECPGPAAPSL
jgi:hypothetical protein